MIAATGAMAQYKDRYVLDSGEYPFTDVGFIIGDDVNAWDASTNLPFFYRAPGSADESIVIDGFASPTTRALKLNTEDATIEFRLTDDPVLNPPVTIIPGQDIFIDAKMQFVVSDDPPGETDLNGVKIALWVDAATSNLVVRHGMVGYSDGTDVFDAWDTGLEHFRYVTNTIVDVGFPILAETWYDVKIIMDTYDTSEELELGFNIASAFKIAVNNVDVFPNANALADGWKTEMGDLIDDDGGFTSGGTWFLSCLPFASHLERLALDNLSFKGTGAIGSLAVSLEPLYDVTSAVESDNEAVNYEGGGSIVFTLVDETGITLPGKFKALTEIVAIATPDIVMGGTYTFYAWVVTTNGTIVTSPNDVFVADGNEITVTVLADTEIKAVFTYMGDSSPQDYFNFPDEKYNNDATRDWLSYYKVPYNLNGLKLFETANLLGLDPRISACDLVITQFNVDLPNKVDGKWDIVFVLDDETNSVFSTTYNGSAKQFATYAQGDFFVEGKQILGAPGWDPFPTLKKVDGTFSIANPGSYAFFRIKVEAGERIKISVYTTQELKKAMELGFDIKLQANISDGGDEIRFIPLEGKHYSYALDLNGFDIESNFVVIGGANKNNAKIGDCHIGSTMTVTIWDSSGKKASIGDPASTFNGGGYGFVVRGGGVDVTLDGVTVYGNQAAIGMNGMDQGSTVTLKNCDFIGTTFAAFLTANHTYSFENCTFDAGTGVHIKSGTAEFINCVINAYAEYSDPEHNTNGADPTGNAFVVECTGGYITPLIITIDGGVFTSENGWALEQFSDGGGNYATVTLKGDWKFAGYDPVNGEEVTGANAINVKDNCIDTE